MRFSISLMILLAVGLLLLACSAQPGQLQANPQAPQSGVNDASSIIPEGPSGNIPVRTLSDVPLTGGTTRLDYESLDSDNGRLYLAHWALI